MLKSCISPLVFGLSILSNAKVISMDHTPCKTWYHHIFEKSSLYFLHIINLLVIYDLPTNLLQKNYHLLLLLLHLKLCRTTLFFITCATILVFWQCCVDVLFLFYLWLCMISLVVWIYSKVIILFLFLFLILHSILNPNILNVCRLTYFGKRKMYQIYISCS